TSDRCRMHSQRQQTNETIVSHSQLTRSRWTDSVVTHLAPGRRNHEKGRIMVKYTSSPERSETRSRLTIMQMLRFPLVWLGLVMAMATPTIILATTWAVQAKTPVSADLFMQSVVKRDGALGWHQLCP